MKIAFQKILYRNFMQFHTLFVQRNAWQFVITQVLLKLAEIDAFGRASFDRTQSPPRNHLQIMFRLLEAVDAQPNTRSFVQAVHLMIKFCVSTKFGSH